MVWTHFYDMHSGGEQKLDWAHVYIEAPLDEAKIIFYNRFGRNPERVTCTCCGDDYSISEWPSLKQATGFNRHCANLETPRIDRRYVTSDDPWFKEHYYLEPDEEAEAKKRGYTVEENLAAKIGRQHGTDYGRYMTLDEYFDPKRVVTGITDGLALAIYESEIKDKERKGSVYVWV